jgi:hypothetical protein
MSIFWYIPPLVLFIFIIYYNYVVTRSITRAAEFVRLLIALVIALAAVGLFIWAIVAPLDCSVRITLAATLGGAVTFLLKDPGGNLRQY